MAADYGTLPAACSRTSLHVGTVADLNAIFYVTRMACPWRMLPKDFPPWQTVYGYFRRWTQQGLWERLNAALVEKVRTQANRNSKPSAAVLDSQSVKTSEGGKPVGWMCTNKLRDANGILL